MTFHTCILWLRGRKIEKNTQGVKTVTAKNQLGIRLGRGNNRISHNWRKVKDPASPQQVPNGWETFQKRQSLH